VSLSCAAAAVLSLAAAQAGGAPGSPGAGSPAAGPGNAAQAAGAQEAVNPPPSMNMRIPGTRTSPSEMSAGLDLALSTQLLTQTINQTGGASQVVQTGLQISPLLAGGLLVRRFGVALGYNPQLYLVSVTEGPLDVLHRGWLLMEYNAAATWRLYLAERFTYGTNNLATPVLGNGGSIGQQPPTLNPVRLASVEYINNETSVGVSSRISKRLRFTFVAAFLNSGGVDAASQQVMPYQWGPRAEATLDWNVSSSSTLGTALAAQANIFPVLYAATSTSATPVSGPGRQIYIGTVAETWRIRLSRYTSTWLIGGVSLSNTDSVTDLSYKRVAPVLGAGLDSGTNTRQPVRAFLQVLLAPYVDPYLAVEYQRLSANASLTWQPSTPWLVGLAATAAYVPYRNQAQVASSASKYGTGGPTISYVPVKALAFSAGAYWQWQLGSPVAAASFNQWGGYFTVTVSDFEHI